jgi:hypothetical protein
MPFVSHNLLLMIPTMQLVSGTSIKNQHSWNHSQSKLLRLLQHLTTATFPNPNLQARYRHGICMLGGNSKHKEECLYEFDVLMSGGGHSVKNNSNFTDPPLCACDEGLEHSEPNMASH